MERRWGCRSERRTEEKPDGGPWHHPGVRGMLALPLSVQPNETCPGDKSVPRGVCADRRTGQFLLSGHGPEGTPSGWGTKQDSWPRGRKATCVDVGLLETGISRNADILSRPTAHP